MTSDFFFLQGRFVGGSVAKCDQCWGSPTWLFQTWLFWKATEEYPNLVGISAPTKKRLAPPPPQFPADTPPPPPCGNPIPPPGIFNKKPTPAPSWRFGLPLPRAGKNRKYSKRPPSKSQGYQNQSFSSVLSGPFPPTLSPSFSPLFPLQALCTLPPHFPSSPPP